MRKKLESSTWREQSVEEQQNRLGVIFGAATAVRKEEFDFRVRGRRPWALYTSCAGAGRPGMGGRVTRRPPETPRATRAPVPVNPAD
jgi:hypothetical protein